MTQRPPPSRTSRIRQREAMLNALAKLTGCTALVVTVAVVFYVAVTQIDRHGPRIDPSLMGEAVEAPSEQRPPAQQASSGGILGLNQLPSAPQSTADQGQDSAMADARKARIEAAVRQFFTARTLDEKLASSRERERVRPLMEAYYQNHLLNPGAFQSLGWVMPVNEPGHHLAYAQALFANAEPLCVIVEEGSEGQVSVDWESSVHYGELEWKDFLARKPVQPVLFRVIASKVSSPAEIPPDAASLEVIELRHPVEPGVLHAYFNRDDPQFSPLLEQLRLGNWTNVPLTLRISYPGPTSSARAVRIASVEGKGWLILQNRRS